MNTPQNDPPQRVEGQKDTRLTGERFDELRRSLEILYIKNNLSGRLHFLQAWPDVAAYLFGDVLIGYDSDGTEDKKHRAELEDHAEGRRMQLLEIAENLEEKSVVKGVLQVEYVEGVVRGLGRDLSLLFYAPRFVDRVFPPPAPEPALEEAGPEEALQEPPSPPESASPAAPPVGFVDPDSVQPISVSLPPAPTAPSQTPLIFQKPKNMQEPQMPAPPGGEIKNDTE